MPILAPLKSLLCFFSQTDKKYIRLTEVGIEEIEKFDKSKIESLLEEKIKKLTVESLEDSSKLFNKTAKRTILIGIGGAILGAILSMGATKCNQSYQQKQQPNIVLIPKIQIIHDTIYRFVH